MVKLFIKEKCLRTFGLAGMLSIFRSITSVTDSQISTEIDLNFLNQMSASTHQLAPVPVTHLAR